MRRISGYVCSIGYPHEPPKREDVAISPDSTHDIPADVREAIHAFLNACRREARPFAATEAIDAVRRVFPDLHIADADLVDAITSEALTAGFDVGARPGKTPETVQRKAIERWDNEGGAPARTARRKASGNAASSSRRRTGKKDSNG